MKKVFFLSTIATSLTLLSSCFTNPITGRKSFNAIPESEMRSMATTQYTSFLSENKPVPGTADAEMVQRVGNKLAISTQQYLASVGKADLISGYQWEFNLVNNSEANAWCMPGGKIVVYSGILPLTKTEAGLAVVMGHEIAHAISRHGNERTSQQLAQQLGGLALSEALSTKPEQTRGIFNTAYGVATTYGVLLPYSRSHESEADEIGLYIMARAGYNPEEAVSFWQRMSAQAGTKPPVIVSTHPSDQRRIKDIQKLLPKAKEYYKPQ